MLKKGMLALSCLMIVNLTACGGYEDSLEDPSRMTDHELDEDFFDADDGINRTTHALTNSTLTQTLFRESVGLRIGGSNRCSGVQISSRYILTAAHCLESSVPYPGWPIRRDGTVWVEVRYSSASTGTIVSFSGNADFVIHSKHLPGGPEVDFDVALLRLSGAPSSFYRARIYNESRIPGFTHYIVGWSQPGTTTQSKNYGTATMFFASNSTGVVLLETNNQHTISGDSGSPYMVRGASGSTVRYITDAIHKARGTYAGKSVMKGARTYVFWPWVVTTAAGMGDPLSCGTTSIAGLSYLYGCE